MKINRHQRKCQKIKHDYSSEFGVDLSFFSDVTGTLALYISVETTLWLQGCTSVRLLCSC